MIRLNREELVFSISTRLRACLSVTVRSYPRVCVYASIRVVKRLYASRRASGGTVRIHASLRVTVFSMSFDVPVAPSRIFSMFFDVPEAPSIAFLMFFGALGRLERARIIWGPKIKTIFDTFGTI